MEVIQWVVSGPYGSYGLYSGYWDIQVNTFRAVIVSHYSGYMFYITLCYRSVAPWRRGKFD